MRQQLFFFCMLISSGATIHNMELVLYNHDLLSQITHQICIVNNWNTPKIKTDIQSCTHINTTFRDYYMSENTHKNLIRHMALYNNTSDLHDSCFFGYKTINNKIKYLFSKIENKTENFTHDDLSDAWYLNSAIACTAIANERFIELETLLCRAIKKYELGKAEILITAGIDCNSTRCQNPLALMAQIGYIQTFPLTQKKSFFTIIRMLLKKGIHPDSRPYPTSISLLQLAAWKKYKRLAHSLLECGADPYTKSFNDQQNAFDLEHGEPKGWLATLVEEVEKSKKS